MRSKRDTQGSLDFQPSNLKITNEYRERYARVSAILDANPRILDLVHEDLKEAIESEHKAARQEGRRCTYTTENALRAILCQVIEGESLRVTCIRIDESDSLRRFVRIDHGPMMDFTTLDRFKNAVRLETWRKVNKELGVFGIEEELVTGERLRVDTTTFETNIHYPTDSSLLWDVYRVLARLIERIRELDPDVVGDRRLQTCRAKKLHVWLARKAARKGTKNPQVQDRYAALMGLVAAVLAWSADIAEALRRKCRKARSSRSCATLLDSRLVEQMNEFRELGERVVDQARRRVLEEEQVPSDEKLYSIFEPHTELLKRGKAGKPIEFGHMVFLQQTGEKFIADFDVFDKKPVEYKLIDSALERHERLFGQLPSILAADRASYESMDKIRELEKKIDVVAIGKMGPKTERDDERERSMAFKVGQAFRAGIEGSISFLKRVFRMYRCFNKSWEHYRATVGAIIVAHNLLILARGG